VPTPKRRWRAVLAVAAAAGGVRLFAWRRHRRGPAEVREARQLDLAPNPSGEGLVLVVNAGAGSTGEETADELRRLLPKADVIALEDPADLERTLRAGAERDGVTAIGASGGDGTLSAAAAIAADLGLPLVAIPGGTLNHLARDLGLESADDAIEGVRQGGVACIDLGVVGDRTFVNTLTFGGYSAVVDARERLEGRLGKWPALLVALVRELPKMVPCRIELDGEPTEVWLAWIGNGAYAPPGLAPGWREDLGDGVLDVRLLHNGRLARTRFVAAALLGRLRHLPLYSERHVGSLRLRSLEGPLRLAADGETFDGGDELVIEKRRRALQIVLPDRGTGSDR
jgi:undecaprenyl-diphosphatase